MSLWSELRRAFSPMEEPLRPKSDRQAVAFNRERLAAQHYRSMPDYQARAIDSYTTYPGWSEQILAAQGLTARPWRYPTINEALGVPAIFRAVSLISNTTGQLAMEAYRNGVRLSDADAPRLIKRPDPFRIPRDFYRDTAFDMASRGEFWWWIAARDIDDSAMSLIRVPPWEVKVDPNQRDRLRPTIKWLGQEVPSNRMVHGTFLLDDTGYRGVGPLQLCGAAVSVAVEAQEWAANLFSEGGYPSIVIKATGSLGQSDPDFEMDETLAAQNEAARLRAQWMERDHNTPAVIDEGIEDVKPFPVDPSGAQMLEGRQYENGEAARMFGIPGSLLEYQQSGSSLTYQNLEGEFTKFVRTCLAPGYLEPIEQHMSDLLTRSTVARFAVKGFMRADVKTRAEVYEKLIPLGVISPEEARQDEGYAPGDVEYAPVPFSPPQAIPNLLPIEPRAQPTVVAEAGEVRCNGTRSLRGILRPCGKLLAERGPFVGTCPRCKKEFVAA